MIAKNHLILGFLAGSITAEILNLDTVNLVVMSGAGIVGALLPDIDHPTSTFGKKLWPISWFISLIFGHRGVTHSLLIVAIMIFLLLFKWGALNYIEIGLLVGYLSHLFGDYMTPLGIPLFWPILTRYRSPFCFKTGGFSETMFVQLLLLITGFIFYRMHYGN